jgi:hypothetical protein
MQVAAKRHADEAGPDCGGKRWNQGAENQAAWFTTTAIFQPLTWL